jgi:hypothetical protein
MPRRNPATDIAPLIAVRAVASRTPTAPPAPVVRFFDEPPLPDEVYTRAADVAQTHQPAVPVWQGPLQEAPAVAWLRVPPAHPGSEPPQRTDRAWRRGRR